MRSDVHQFDLVAPGSLHAVLDLLSAEPGVYTPIAGGTELMVALGAGRLASRRLVSLSGLGELRFIDANPDHITVGSGTTFTDLRRHPGIARHFALLAKAASWTGSIANQNRSTLGGNLANASPAADSSPVLLAYNAEITLISRTGSRTLPYSAFHLGYKQTALRPDELIHSITLHHTEAVGTSYLRKVGTRNAQAISKVVLAGIAHVESGTVAHVRLAAASLAPTPVRLLEVERTLAGQPVTPATIASAQAALRAAISPIDDIRSTAQYRTAVATNLLAEFLDSL